MRKNGLTVGARLMERWFSRGARAMTKGEKSGDESPSDYDERIVTMTWALGFARVVDAENICSPPGTLANDAPRA